MKNYISFDVDEQETAQTETPDPKAGLTLMVVEVSMTIIPDDLGDLIDAWGENL